MEKIIFYAFGSLLLLSAVYVLFSEKMVRAVFALFFTFFAIAALILFAGSDFLAISHLIIYIGGVLILLIFGLMLSNKSFLQLMDKDNSLSITKIKMIVLSIVLFLFSYGGIQLLKSISENSLIVESKENINSMEFLGYKYLSKYAFPFELISILLLLILIAVAFISRPKIEQND